MKIYFDSSHYHKENRSDLAEILRPVINTRTLEENLDVYGLQITQYEVVSVPEESDFCVLTMAWDYYVKTGQLEKARAFIKQARLFNKPILIWQSGDFSVRFQDEDIWLFQCGGLRSARSPRQFAQPVFIRDPLEELNLSEIRIRSKGARPVVGFCGQADYTFNHAISARIRFGLHNLKSVLNISPYELIPLSPLPTKTRELALNQLSGNSDIQTNFIKRKKYRAGAHSIEERKDSRNEFWHNMLESDYIICARGTGNFSARLYETLAMGRIPILIDTDCILPYDHIINWKEYCIWVNSKDMESLPQRVLAFHAGFSENDFIEHQKKCRALWEERLSFSGFFKHFAEHFS